MLIVWFLLEIYHRKDHLNLICEGQCKLYDHGEDDAGYVYDDEAVYHGFKHVTWLVVVNIVETYHYVLYTS